MNSTLLPAVLGQLLRSQKDLCDTEAFPWSLSLTILELQNGVGWEGP